MPRFFKSLRSRLFLLVTVALLPAIGVIIVSGLEHQKKDILEAQTELKRLVAQVSREQAQKILHTQQLLMSLSRLPEVQRRDTVAFRAYFAQVREQSPSYDNFGLIGPDGYLLASVQPVSAPVYLGDRKHFQEALKNRKFAISKLLVSRTLLKPSLVCTYPVMDESGKVVAVLFANLNLAWLNDMAVQAHLPAGSVLTIIDEDGAIMAKHPRAEHWVGKSLPPDGLLGIIKKHGEGVAQTVGMNGVPRLFAFTPLGAEPRIGYVYAGVPQRVINAASQQILIRNLAILVGALLLALGLAWLCGHLFVSRRLSTLISATQQMAAGDLSVRANISGGPEELEQLAQAFDHLAASLEDRDTKRRQAENALLESEAKYRLLFENNPQPMWVYDLESLAILKVNKAAVALYGYSREEFLAMTIKSLRHPEDVAALLKKVEELKITQGVGSSGEWRHVKKSGEIFDVEIVSHEIGFNGQRARLVLAKDITLRKAAQEALQETEDRLRLLVDQSFDGIFVHENFIIKDLNQQMADIAGYSQSELLNVSAIDLFTPDSQDRIHDYVSSGKKGIFELDLLRKDGKIVPVETIGTPCTFHGQTARIVAVKDITTRKQAEEEIHNREAKLRSIFRAAPTGIGMVVNRVLVEVNDRILEMTGYSTQELIGQSARILYPTQEDFDFVGKEKYRQILEKGTGYVETRWRRKDGSIIEVLLSSTPIVAGDFSSGVTFTVLDITARKQAEEKLNQNLVEMTLLNKISHLISSNIALEDMVQAIVNGISEFLDVDLVILFLKEEERLPHLVVGPQDSSYKFDTVPVHRVGECLCGLAAQDEQSVYAQDISTDPRCTMAECKEAGLRSFAALPLKRSDRVIGVLGLARAIPHDFANQSSLLEYIAAEISLGLSNSLLFSEAAARTVELSQEVTEHKRTEQALRESEERLKYVLEGSQQGTWDWNLETGEIIRNERWAHLLGYTLHEVESTAKQGLALIHPDDQAAVLKSIQDHLEGRTPEYESEYRMLAKDKRYKWILDRGRIVKWDNEGHPLRMSGTHTDVTERRELGEQLVKAQKMEAVGVLAGGVAHDFNNLLTAIMGYSDLMQMGLPSENPLSHYIEEIAKAANRGASLTRQLLAFSRKQILQPQVINLNDVVQDMDKMLRRLIGEDIDLRNFLGHNLGLVKADPSQIGQIIMNLAVNARDAMPQGGKLTIETANVFLDESYAKDHAEVIPGPYVMLALSDDGLGMDAETMSHIFEPFFTTKKDGKGTGLGLATVYGIVKQSGGYVWVYSEPGQGTAFKIYLSQVEEPKDRITEETVEVVSPISLEQAQTILVVEDDAALRELISITLRKDGFTVLAAAHGGEAMLLGEAEKGPIHLLLTDVVMPQMSGRVLAERLIPNHPEMKVLFMSGYTENAIVRHGILDEGINFIPKPFKIVSLIRKIREVIGTGAPS